TGGSLGIGTSIVTKGARGIGMSVLTSGTSPVTVRGPPAVIAIKIFRWRQQGVMERPRRAVTHDFVRPVGNSKVTIF
ncbi:hypothetical protein DVA69_20590, partial [Acinetobacter baumannii]